VNRRTLASGIAGVAAYGVAEATGCGRASDAIYSQRLATCRTCEAFEEGQRVASWTCRQCGCNLHRKARLTVARCPLGRW